MLLGKKKIQRITVGVIIGVIVLSLGLSLLSAAAAPRSRSGAAGGGRPATDAVATTAPSPAGAPLGRTADPKPVTRTPQGEATQVSDDEHLGGLVGYIAFMVGGVFLLARSRRRTRKPATEDPDFVVTATS
ncbi:hypothetical protein [Intrasporangium oryzae]|uniref:hypothetical protein n=1 Tax=Intrasporangium oryzae TaxID=412687 RepID=UPI0004B7F2E6|nr:hypothetical protein [Intrasporangium oryzae]